MNAVLPAESPGRAELVFALGVGLLLVSGLLPWIAASEAIPVADPSEEAEGLASFDEEHTSEEILGIDRVDWVVLAGVGLVATILVVTEPWSQIVLAFAAASGVAAVGLGAVYLVDPVWMYSDWIKPDVAAVASTGPGVYLAICGGVLQLGGCYLAYSESESTSGAQQLDAPSPAQPGANQPGQPQGPRGGQPPQQEPRRQQRPPGQQPPQGAGPNQGQPSQGQPRQRGGQQQPSGQPPANEQPPNEQRSPGRQPPQNQHEGGQQPQGTPPNRQQSTETPHDPSGQPGNNTPEPERSPTEGDPEQPPTERGPEQPPSGQQRDARQQPSNREPTEADPVEEPECSDQPAGVSRQGTGTGQPKKSPEEQTERRSNSDETDRQEK